MVSNDRITLKLLGWYEANKRDLPWRSSQNPYLVWLSEILLQQTRVDQGLPYFERFVKKYPTVDDLALASMEEVLKMWQGLGYYSRAHNLHATAQYISSTLNGQFPTSYKELRKLKGVGPYTAAAISSISFGEKQAVVDGNVFRVLSRLFGIETPINQSAAYGIFEELSLKLMGHHEPGIYNQALMELGAVVCTPKNPDCTNCPISDSCFALKQNVQKLFPKKIPSKAKKIRFLNYVLLKCQGKIHLQKRAMDDIWKGMFEPMLVESNKLLESEEILLHFQKSMVISSIIQFQDTKHLLTHRTLHIRFFSAEIDEMDELSEDIWINTTELAFFALPKPISDFFSRYGETLF